MIASERSIIYNIVYRHTFVASYVFLSRSHKLYAFRY